MTHPDDTKLAEEAALEFSDRENANFNDWVAVIARARAKQREEFEAELDDFRDILLNQRGALAENGMTNDQVNDVLREFDNLFYLSLAPVESGKVMRENGWEIWIEFGYKACERGVNLIAAIEDARSRMLADAPVGTSGTGGNHDRS